MAFRSLDFQHIARFNSSTSSTLLDRYSDFVDKQILEEYNEPTSKTFAPSNFRCDRRCWFRLRGVQPDRPEKGDQVLNFTARIGEACHTLVQSNLSKMLGEDWIDVEEYLKSIDFPYEYKVTKDGFETKVEILKPYPIKFACDGIIRLNGKYYLLEIKSSEYKAFDELIDIKPHHRDQIEFYSSILKLEDVIVIYIDRQYGNLKCYEHHIPEYKQRAIFEKMDDILKRVESNIAPDRLPSNDPFCNGCLYKVKCKQWG